MVEVVADFDACNLHVVGYSEPVDVELTLAELQPIPALDPGSADGHPLRDELLQPHLGILPAPRREEALPEGP